MRDIATLKQRVDHAERHLRTTETARNRESEALMDMWRKIRERFTHQEGEIAHYRAEVESLTESNESLSRMVDDLIVIIDGNIERGRDETVPKITTLAGDLLASEPSADDLARFADDPPEARQAPTRDPAADGGPAETEDIIDLDQDVIDLADQAQPETLLAEADHDDDDADWDAAAESLSPGIRSLIQRVHGSVREPDGFSPAVDDDVEDDDLARELQEIEMLRNELSGLRDRISASEA